jgi:glycerol uptake facilitator protein
MHSYVAEFIGTMLLIIFGDGVVAGVLLSKSKAQNSGWIVISFGWGMAVLVAVYVVGRISGAHINPAITIALATVGKFPWAQVPGYLIAQFLGAFVGGVIVYLMYLPHWAETEDPGLKLASFCTGPAIRNTTTNLISEIIGTFVLVFCVLGIGANKDAAAAGLSSAIVGFLVLGIGLSLGGPTGYAINPARDFGPRMAHFVLPIKGKGGPDWAYSWIPVVGPIIGGIIGAVLYVQLFPV